MPDLRRSLQPKQAPGMLLHVQLQLGRFPHCSSSSQSPALQRVSPPNWCQGPKSPWPQHALGRLAVRPWGAKESRGASSACLSNAAASVSPRLTTARGWGGGDRGSETIASTGWCWEGVRGAEPQPGTLVRPAEKNRRLLTSRGSRAWFSIAHDH